MVEQRSSTNVSSSNEPKTNDDCLDVENNVQQHDQEKGPSPPAAAPSATLQPNSSCPEPKTMATLDDNNVHQELDSSEGPSVGNTTTNDNSNCNNDDSLSRDRIATSNSNGGECLLNARKIVGLKNLGNTCYANSCLQALYLTNKFRENVMKRPDFGPIHQSLSRLFIQMNQAGTPLPLPADPRFQVIKPDRFVQEFRRRKPQFIQNEQHDAQEFLSILLECLHQEANQVPKTMAKNQTGQQQQNISAAAATNSREAWTFHVNNIENSYYSRLFSGQLESSLRCLTCQHTSLSWSCFWQLPLHLATSTDTTNTTATNNNNNNDNHDDDDDGTSTSTATTLSIDGCIREYTAPEIMQDDCAPFCERCNQKRPSSKRQTICRVPHYLIVHLKRFTHTGTKINRKVIINPILNVGEKRFAIYACVLHRGTETMGHYFTVYNDYCKEWILFDDDMIYSNITYEQVESILQYHSYICFYKAISPIITTTNNNRISNQQQQQQ